MQKINISTNTKPFELSIEEQEILDSQINLDKNLYTDAESPYTNLKKKYQL